MAITGVQPRIRPLRDADRRWLRRRLDERWGGTMQAYRGELVDAGVAAGLVAAGAMDALAGVLLYRPVPAAARGAATAWEIILVEAFERGRGIGTALVEALAAAARADGASAIRATTTNDNTAALRFYQRRGFRLVALRSGAVDEARLRLKPSIPVAGEDGIPIRDELDVELDLEPGPD